MKRLHRDLQDASQYLDQKYQTITLQNIITEVLQSNLSEQTKMALAQILAKEEGLFSLNLTREQQIEIVAAYRKLLDYLKYIVSYYVIPRIDNLDFLDNVVLHDFVADNLRIHLQAKLEGIKQTKGSPNTDKRLLIQDCLVSIAVLLREQSKLPIHEQFHAMFRLLDDNRLKAMVMQYNDGFDAQLNLLRIERGYSFEQAKISVSETYGAQVKFFYSGSDIEPNTTALMFDRVIESLILELGLDGSNLNLIELSAYFVSCLTLSDSDLADLLSAA